MDTDLRRCDDKEQITLRPLRGEALYVLCVNDTIYPPNRKLDKLGQVSYHVPMSAVAVTPIRKQGQRAWTDAQRAQQAANLRTRQIWLKSTGPKTEDGKRISSQNACGEFYEDRRELRLIKHYLRIQKSYIDLLRLYTNQQDSLSPHHYYALNYQLYIFENELVDTERQIFDGMTFYQIVGIDNRIGKGNIVPLKGAPPS